MGLWGAVRGLVSFFVALVNHGLSLGIHIGVAAALFFAARYSGAIGKAALQHREQVVELVYWRDPKKSGVAFALSFILLLCLANFTYPHHLSHGVPNPSEKSCSLISVVAYTGLILLAATVSLRLYAMALKMAGKGGDGESSFLKSFLDKELEIPDERVHAQVDVCLGQIRQNAASLRRLILVEDPVATVKSGGERDGCLEFGLLLWALTYVGAWFSGLTLVALALIGAFTIPKVYELYQPQIDEYWALAAGHIKTVTDQVEDKLPFLKKKQT